MLTAPRERPDPYTQLPFQSHNLVSRPAHITRTVCQCGCDTPARPVAPARYRVCYIPLQFPFPTQAPVIRTFSCRHTCWGYALSRACLSDIRQ